MDTFVIRRAKGLHIVLSLGHIILNIEYLAVKSADNRRTPHGLPMRVTTFDKHYKTLNILHNYDASRPFGHLWGLEGSSRVHQGSPNVIQVSKRGRPKLMLA